MNVARIRLLTCSAAYVTIISFFQGKTANKMVDKYGLVDVLLGVLENNQLPDNVHQSTLALLGHLCNNDFEVVSIKSFGFPVIG